MRPRTATPHSPHSGPRDSPAHDRELTRNSILRISDSKTIQLIQEWEKEECLWNTNLEDYPNKEERAVATAIIAEKLDLPNFKPEHVTMKFKNLRNSYCQELKKMANDEHYKPKVFWFSYMDKFLKPHLQKINTYMESNKVVQQDNSTYEIKTEIDSDDDQDWNVDNNTQSEASCSNSIRIEAFTERSNSENGEPNHKKRKLVHRRSENGDHSDPLQAITGDNLVRIVTKQTEKQNGDTQLRKADYCDTFGSYIASLLRTLPPKKALMLQPKIVDLIVSVGLEELRDDDSDS